jgi:hypothetical protein
MEIFYMGYLVIIKALVPIHALFSGNLAVLYFLKSPWFKGVAENFMVHISAKIHLNKDKYHVLRNVTLPTADGTTQIDHIIVSEYGVFVIETKNMKGWIFGGARQKTVDPENIQVYQQISKPDSTRTTNT